MKWWNQHNKKIKYFSSDKFDEHNNKFGKLQSPGSKLMNGTNISTLTTLKIDISDHPFTKDNIFEVTVTFTTRGTNIGIVFQYYEDHNMTYISQFKNKISWKHALPMRNKTNLWILSIRRKEPKQYKRVMESISIQHLTGK